MRIWSIFDAFPYWLLIYYSLTLFCCSIELSMSSDLFDMESKEELTSSQDLFAEVKSVIFMPRPAEIIFDRSPVLKIYLKIYRPNYWWVLRLRAFLGLQCITSFPKQSACSQLKVLTMFPNCQVVGKQELRKVGNIRPKAHMSAARFLNRGHNSVKIQRGVIVKVS